LTQESPKTDPRKTSRKPPSRLGKEKTPSYCHSLELVTSTGEWHHPIRSETAYFLRESKRCVIWTPLSPCVLRSQHRYGLDNGILGTGEGTVSIATVSIHDVGSSPQTQPQLRFGHPRSRVQHGGIVSAQQLYLRKLPASSRPPFGFGHSEKHLLTVG
jgi:hypothetical protein